MIAENSTVARLVSDVLARNRNDPDFEVSVLTCSITYMYVFSHHYNPSPIGLFVFIPPQASATFSLRCFSIISSPHDIHAQGQYRRLALGLSLTPTDAQNNPELLPPVDFDQIRSLTSEMQKIISAGTLDSPTWDLIRTAKLAARMYAPLGTFMTLGDYVRLIRQFLDAFKNAEQHTLPKDRGIEREGYLVLNTSDIFALQNDLKGRQVDNPLLSKLSNFLI
jgi:glycerol-3-phosphate O-acyltransferase/dihydroxyacetone phosphate acyltransferase